MVYMQTTLALMDQLHNNHVAQGERHNQANIIKISVFLLLASADRHCEASGLISEVKTRGDERVSASILTRCIY